MIAENVQNVLKEIAGGNAFGEKITLVAATKTRTSEEINEAIAAGVTDIVENKVQEFRDKYDLVHGANRHFIGHLQTNKVRQIVGKVDMIQSVDSEKLAGEIAKHSLANGITTDILIEVNIGNEVSKSGVAPQGLEELLFRIGTMRGISVKGLMAIPPICENKAELCGYFSAMRQSYVDIAAKKIDNVRMDCLSMGMSSDFPEAIACGATMVRVGSSLFGKRDYPQH